MSFFHDIMNMSVSELSFTFVTSATSQGITTTIPADAQAGDFAILFDFTSGGTPTSVTPTNWQLIRSDFNGVATYIRSSYKILTDGEPGSSISGGNGTVSLKTFFIFRPSISIQNVTIGSLNGQSSASAPSSQTLNMTLGVTPLIGFATYGTTGSGGGFGPGESAGVMNTVNNITAYSQSSRYVVYNKGSSPVSTTISLSDGGVNVMQSFYCQFT